MKLCGIEIEPSRKSDASCRTFDAVLTAIRSYGKETP